MHRAYQPFTPANNKLLKKRWDDKKFYNHRQKVQIAKAVIDDKPPTTYMHTHLKRKKMQMEEERLAIIERDNRILLEKMCHIMLTRGSVDHTNCYDAKSLNRMARQRELLRVTHENRAIMRRILSKQATYSHHQWEAEWNMNKMYMKNIAKYPWYDQWSKMHSKRRTSHDDHDGPGYGPRKNSTATSLDQSRGGNKEANSEKKRPARRQRKLSHHSKRGGGNGSGVS